MSFISKFFKWVADQYRKVIPSVKKSVQIGISVLENIKNYVDSPVVDVLTAIIPSDIDDKTVKLIREYLPKLLAKLQFLEGELDKKEIVEFIDKLNSLEDPDAHAIFTHGIASGINKYISNEIGSISQAFLTTETVFKGEEAVLKSA